MPWVGNVFTWLANSLNPAVTNTPISSSDWNAGIADLGTAVSDVPRFATAQANAFRFGGIAGGTANAITVSLTPALTAYTNGLTLWFFSGAAANTTAATLSVNGLAATAIQLGGAALTGGEIAISRLYQVTYYNSVFHLTQAAVQAPLTLTSTAAGTLLTMTSTDAGAGTGPDLVLFRNSATPAAADLIGGIKMDGKDSAGNTETYVHLIPQIDDPTNGSEDSALFIRTKRAGATQDMLITGGCWRASGSVADTGAGTVNATGIYISGHPVGETVTVSANKNGTDQTGIATGADTKVTFGTEDWDIGAAFASSTWTPPAGKYTIKGQITYTSANAVDDEEMAVKLYKNGSTHREWRQARGSTANMSMQITVDVDANGTDTFEIYGRKGSGGTGTVSGSTALTWFQGKAM